MKDTGKTEWDPLFSKILNDRRYNRNTTKQRIIRIDLRPDGTYLKTIIEGGV